MTDDGRLGPNSSAPAATRLLPARRLGPGQIGLRPPRRGRHSPTDHLLASALTSARTAVSIRRHGLGDTAVMADRNVLGGPLEPCGTDPLTGFYRDGCCSTGSEDLGSHTICAVVTEEFLDHQRSIGNDLSTPVPQFRFPGLVPGDRWCVTARNWLRAHHDGAAAFVVLACTHERALDIVSLEILREHAVDVPPSTAALEE